MNCSHQSLVEDPFRGAISTADERRMRAHLADCEPCRAYYRRRQIFASLDPQAIPAEERIGRGLGLKKPARTFVFPATAAAVLAVAAVLFLFIRPARVEKGEGFTARGSGLAPESSIAVYRVGDHTLLSASGAVRCDDELAFSYRNESHKPYVMIFGVDEASRVYWFYPAWTSDSDNPTALKTDPAHVTVQLTEAIKHPLAGSKLTMHGLFLDQPATVRDVESALEKNPVRIQFPGAIDNAQMFEVGQ